MPTSRRSSTPATTSAPTELALLRALPEQPLWSAEPLATSLAERFGCAPRAVRPLLDALDVRLDVPGALVGQLDETWLYRASTAPEGVEGVVAWRQLGSTHLMVRTFARDAVERERRLRALHAKLAERPLAQLERPGAPAPKRALNRADWALLAAARAMPFAPLDALAQKADVSARVAKERLAKLVAERALVVEAEPRAGALLRLLVRVSPSSSAAARHALACFDGVVRSFVPAAREATLVDAEVLAPTDAERAQALDVPGVASVDVLPVTRAWRDDGALDALLRKAALTARDA